MCIAFAGLNIILRLQFVRKRLCPDYSKKYFVENKSERELSKRRLDLRYEDLQCTIPKVYGCYIYWYLLEGKESCYITQFLPELAPCDNFCFNSMDGRFFSSWKSLQLASWVYFLSITNQHIKWVETLHN